MDGGFGQAAHRNLALQPKSKMKKADNNKMFLPPEEFDIPYDSNGLKSDLEGKIQICIRNGLVALFFQTIS